MPTLGPGNVPVPLTPTPFNLPLSKPLHNVFLKYGGTTSKGARSSVWSTAISNVANIEDKEVTSPVLRQVLVLRPFFEVLVLDGLKGLKNCGLKTEKVLRPFLDLKDLKILILDKPNFSS